VSERAIGYECNAEFACSGDQPIFFVESLEGREFCLDGVDLGNYRSVSFGASSVQNYFDFAVAHLSLPFEELQPSIPKDQCTWSCRPCGWHQVPGWIPREGFLSTPVSVSIYWRVGTGLHHTRIHTMEVVEIWREAQSLYCAFYVFVDVCR
jgi:hypothetical protein